MIQGFGLDLVEVKRLRASLRNKKFEARLFHGAERRYCRSAAPPLRYQRFAARFAAKEAFIKACGGILPGFQFNEIRVENDANGRPRLVLSGETRRRFEKKMKGRLMLTLTHTAHWAVAAVVIERRRR